MEAISNNITGINIEEVVSRSLLNHLYEGIYFVSKDRQFQFWNKGAENITGYSASEVINKFCFNNILCHIDEHGHELCKERCPLTACMNNDCYVDARVYLKHKKGHRVPVWVHASPIKNANGEVIGAVEIFIDDSDYDRLKEVNKELEKLNNLKNQFLGMAAHDLRNPLSVALSFSSLLLEMHNDSLDSVQRSIISRIKKASESMLSLINDLLDISAIESGQFSLNPERITVDQLLDLNNFSMTIVAEQKKIAIKQEIEDNLPAVVVDRNRFNQVIENLLSNAVKFSYPETTITLRAKRNTNHIIIDVSDQGQGIAEEDLPKLFKPFETTATRPTGSEVCTGLGLTIVKKILEAHNANITVQSKKNKGTRFSISLPISVE